MIGSVTFLAGLAGAIAAVVAGEWLLRANGNFILPVSHFTEVRVVAGTLPAGAADWLLRLTPAAAFAIQQSAPAYPQVSAAYTVGNGYFPLSPWADLAMLCGYTALAVGLAVVLLRKRDA